MTLVSGFSSFSEGKKRPATWNSVKRLWYDSVVRSKDSRPSVEENQGFYRTSDRFPVGIVQIQECVKSIQSQQ